MLDARNNRSLLLVVEQRFTQSVDGRVWTTGHYAYPFLCRYLGKYQRVFVLSRLAMAAAPPPNARISSGPGVEHIPLPDYRGLSGLLPRIFPICWRTIRACNRADVVIVRSPSTFGALLLPVSAVTGKPFAVEVIGDPADVFAPGVLRHPLRPLVRLVTTHIQRMLCRHARAVCYVSMALRDKYPTGGYVVVCSDCELGPNAFVPVPRSKSRFSAGRLRIVMVATFAQPYKGHDTLIRAISLALGKCPGLDLHVEFIGDGRLQLAVKQQVAQFGLQDRATFHGFIGDDVRLLELLDTADLMVLPSRTEGLPRSIIEGLARGLPCVGTDVGGIPELLDSACVFPRDDAESLANLLISLANDPVEMARQSERNLVRSQDFSAARLRQQFGTFLRVLGLKTEEQSNPI